MWHGACLLQLLRHRERQLRGATESKEGVMAATPVEPPTSVVLRRPTGWPVDWSAVWVGALSAVVVSLIIALIGMAIGAHAIAATRIVRYSAV